MKKVALTLVLQLTIISIQAADINQLIEIASTPLSAQEQSEMIQQNISLMLTKSESGDKAAYAERQRFFGRIPEVTQHLSTLSDDEKRCYGNGKSQNSCRKSQGYTR